jgi:hypothetical protein
MDMKSQPLEEKSSYDQKPYLKTASTANVNLAAATCRPQRRDPEEEHSKFKRELSTAGWNRDFDSSALMEESSTCSRLPRIYCRRNADGFDEGIGGSFILWRASYD